jgi:hypothetical protein
MIAVGLIPAYCNYEKYIMRFVRPDGTHIIARTGQKAVFDYGPENFGGRSIINVKEGDVITKTFSGIPADTKGFLHINPCLFKRVLLEINGRKLYWTNSQGKYINIPCQLHDGKISIRLLSLDAELPAMLYDTQRDYHRSQLNGEDIDGEWLIRFYY